MEAADHINCYSRKIYGGGRGLLEAIFGSLALRD